MFNALIIFKGEDASSSEKVENKQTVPSSNFIRFFYQFLFVQLCAAQGAAMFVRFLPMKIRNCLASDVTSFILN